MSNGGDLTDFSDDTPPRPGTPEDTQTGEDVRLISDDVSCENCVHKDVCAVYKGIQPMFQKWAQQGDPPFDLDELAVICDYYLSPDEVDR